MQITITIDDKLYNQAMQMAEPTMSTDGLFREALNTFVRIQAGKRLAALGGKALDIESIHHNNLKKSSE
jgi:Arc/MetJ family transcription regulator